MMDRRTLFLGAAQAAIAVPASAAHALAMPTLPKASEPSDPTASELLDHLAEAFLRTARPRGAGISLLSDRRRRAPAGVQLQASFGFGPVDKRSGIARHGGGGPWRARAAASEVRSDC